MMENRERQECNVPHYGLNWPGKTGSMVESNKPIQKTLRPCRIESSPDFDKTGNIFIEGDNLDALKLMLKSYSGKVKMIYIDPPYNTGNDFIYKDDFKNHSNWLNMMYPRLRLARQLLRDDGIIFISIDDHEQHNLRMICDEIFGEGNFVGCFVWHSSTAGGLRPKHVVRNHEYIMCYAKDSTILPKLYTELSEEALEGYTGKDELGWYREDCRLAQRKAKRSKNQIYGITCPDSTVLYPPDGYVYRYIKKKFDEALAENLVLFKEVKNSPLLDASGNKGRYNIYIKKYMEDAGGVPTTSLPRTIVGLSNEGTDELAELFGGQIMPYPKSSKLLSYLLRIGTANDIILDFFAGSCTTAHAVMKLNAEDNGNRKFIMVQIPEKCDEKSEAFKAGYKTIADIGKERIRRAAKKIQEEHPDKKLDLGFRVFKVDESNFVTHGSSVCLGADKEENFGV